MITFHQADERTSLPADMFTRAAIVNILRICALRVIVRNEPFRLPMSHKRVATLAAFQSFPYALSSLDEARQLVSMVAGDESTLPGAPRVRDDIDIIIGKIKPTNLLPNGKERSALVEFKDLFTGIRLTHDEITLVDVVSTRATALRAFRSEDLTKLICAAVGTLLDPYLTNGDAEKAGLAFLRSLDSLVGPEIDLSDERLNDYVEHPFALHSFLSPMIKKPASALVGTDGGVILSRVTHAIDFLHLLYNMDKAANVIRLDDHEALGITRDAMKDPGIRESTQAQRAALIALSFTLPKFIFTARIFERGFDSDSPLRFEINHWTTDVELVRLARSRQHLADLPLPHVYQEALSYLGHSTMPALGGGSGQVSILPPWAYNVIQQCRTTSGELRTLMNTLPAIGERIDSRKVFDGRSAAGIDMGQWISYIETLSRFLEKREAEGREINLVRTHYLALSAALAWSQAVPATRPRAPTELVTTGPGLMDTTVDSSIRFGDASRLPPGLVYGAPAIVSFEPKDLVYGTPGVLHVGEGALIKAPAIWSRRPPIVRATLGGIIDPLRWILFAPEKGLTAPELRIRAAELLGSDLQLRENTVEAWAAYVGVPDDLMRAEIINAIDRWAHLFRLDDGGTKLDALGPIAFYSEAAGDYNACAKVRIPRTTALNTVLFLEDQLYGQLKPLGLTYYATRSAAPPHMTIQISKALDSELPRLGVTVRGAV